MLSSPARLLINPTAIRRNRISQRWKILVSVRNEATYRHARKRIASILPRKPHNSTRPNFVTERADVIADLPYDNAIRKREKE